jgi:peptide/nickel transport system permease protein
MSATEIQPGPVDGGARLRPASHRVTGSPFLRYAVRRILHGLLVVLLVALTVFFVSRIVSDPVRLMLQPDATQQQYDALQARLGLDKSVPVQFVDYVKDTASFNFGESFWQRKPVLELIGTRLPQTFLLVGVAMLFAALIGISAGILESLRPGGWTDKAVSAVALTGLSIPNFWLGSMLILLGAVVLGWFPASGSGGISHLVLPVIALSLPSAGRISQVTRAAMINELSSQHITAARAKGLSFRYVIVRHGLRNVLVPISTIVSWEAVYSLAAYSIVVETVFSWPGLGQLVIQAIERQDLILVQGIVIVLAIIVVVINIITDLIYHWIDPRVELT